MGLGIWPFLMAINLYVSIRLTPSLFPHYQGGDTKAQVKPAQPGYSDPQ